MYETLLFLHILGMSLWLGSGFAMNVLMARGVKNSALPPALAPELEFFGKAIFGPLTLFVAATGAWLVSETGTNWSEPYVVTGIVAVVVSALMGPLYMARNSHRLKTTVAEHGPTHPDVAKLKQRLRAGAIFLVLVLVVTTYMMVVKPG